MKEELRISNQLCFPIYALSRHITNLYRPMLEKLNLTYPQYLVMLLLWEHGKQSVKQLGEHLCLDSGTLTPLLKRMEENGFISRNRSQEDERIVEIELTEQGKQLEKEAKIIPENLLNELNISCDKVAQLRELVKEVLAANGSRCMIKQAGDTTEECENK